MSVSNARVETNMQTKIILVAGAFGVALVSTPLGAAGEQLRSHQHMIHRHGAAVMPFDLDKTLHVFAKTKSGGVQSVTIRDASDAKDLDLIRMHLRMEAGNFARGNYSDPSALHGRDMPGIAVLKRNHGKIKVRYRDLTNGAEITYRSSDAKTVAAIHRWFDAQVRDHGQDAVAR
jgi:hypothetical protein